MTDAPLKLFNSLTRELETFTPIHDGEARVYTCGPTVYNYPHIGNMRAYVFADTLGRTLSWKGYKLTHIINITDVGHLTDDADEGEDKLEKAAAERAQSIWDIAKHYTEAFRADVNALNIREPAKWSVATDYIDEMVEFAKSIADKHCYELESGLYFDVSTIEDYAILAGRRAQEQLEDDRSAHMRIDPVKDKRSPADFAIWRKTPAGEKRQMEWDSPWGKGAPGWHLECSVMGERLLGFPFDIHTGGIDHREIHHPNEIAQNQAFCGCGELSNASNSGANIWMHNNFLVERSGKMSKSSGEFLRLQLLKYKGFDPWSYRMMCLQAHYRSELEFSWEGLASAQTRLKRIISQIENLTDRYLREFPSAIKKPNPRQSFELARRHCLHPRLSEYLTRFENAISNDLNTPEALPVLEQLIKEKRLPVDEQIRIARTMLSVLGLGVKSITKFRRKPRDASITLREIEDAIARRKAARADKDFATSDAIRDELAAKGVDLMDGDPLGWEWKLS